MGDGGAATVMVDTESAGLACVIVLRREITYMRDGGEICMVELLSVVGGTCDMKSAP